MDHVAQGNATAHAMQQQFNQAVRMMNGSAPQEQAEAVATLQQLAQRGMPRAAYNVGVAHLRGFHVEQSRDQAGAYLRMAAEQGYQRAYYPFGQLLREGGLTECQEMPLDLRLYLAAKWMWRAACKGEGRAAKALDQAWVPAIFRSLDKGYYR
ncbi:TPR repeat protein [Silvimonas terrae]|uniref:TPR repeat protein n=1 Tax=Silvimonas terrae TaxID=300266 RepID=A0A840RAJ2_9NEIS|nr:sel1 repeat family protein [Silvimonas terrae]MBB5189927.1 TPR repeat protein [Silvimonas terrae]